MSGESRPEKRIAEETSADHLVLLISLLVVLLILPIFESLGADRTVPSVGFNLFLLTGVILYRHKRFVFVPALALFLIEVPLMWLTFFLDYAFLFVLTSILAAGLFAVLSIALLVRVLRRHQAELQSLFGAVSAYLLLGLAWAVLYWAIDRTTTDAFAFNHRITINYTQSSGETTAFSQFVYFSFVTMSTLGYGDVSPRLPVVQTIAWLQAVVGQFYLAVAVAWLVNTLPHSSDKHEEPVRDETQSNAQG